MLTILKKENVYDGTNDKKKEIEIRGLSTDTKPTVEDIGELSNGSTFIEIDTGKIYMFDLENSEWKEI